MSQLGKALLTAELKGTVTRANGQPIQTLADLTTNCGDGGGTNGGTTGSTTGGTTGGTPACDADSDCTAGQVCDTATGQCGAPVAKVKLEEINPVAPNAATGQLLPVTPPATTSSVEFGETLLGIQTKTKLYKISSAGTKDFIIQNIQLSDSNKQNFRMGSVYQGATFAARTWKVGQNPWTVARNGSSDFFFFLNYGPFGKVNAEGTRTDAGSLIITTDAGIFNVNLAGSAKKDSRATVGLYIEDPSRFTVTGESDPDLKTVDDGGTTRRVYLAKNKLFSFRQDSAPRAVYLFNSGVGSGLDELAIQHLKFNADAGGKIVFTPDAAADVTACLAADPAATTACATLVASGNNKIKLGTMTFTPAGSTYAVSEGSLDVKAVSKPAGGGEGVPPIIGGMPTNTNDNPLVNFGLKGASGAPDGTFDLKVHRLIAGFSNKINQGLQKTLIVSGSTKGILKRFNDGAGADVSLDGFKENFKIEDGMILNPVTGAATLKRIVTAVDADPNNPASPSTVSGLRLYNAPGSQPANTEYFAECSTAGTHNCAFFYLYIGDWTGSTTSASCNGGTKFPVIPSYAGTQSERDALFATVMRPDNAAEFACLGGADGMKDETAGTFDPVTGEITFRDLAVRLFAPEVPALSNKNVDATIRLSLTTQCVDPGLVPDTAAKGQALVPNNTLTDSSFNTTLMPLNPLLPYVDQTGSVCGVQRTLHGRGMFQEDTTGTLDNDTDPDNLNFNGFDLAGVGRNVTSQTSVSPANMYIIIKAEVGEF